MCSTEKLTAAYHCATLYCIMTIQPNLEKCTYFSATRDISQALKQKVWICFIHTQREKTGDKLDRDSGMQLKAYGKDIL